MVDSLFKCVGKTALTAQRNKRRLAEEERRVWGVHLKLR